MSAWKKKNEAIPSGGWKQRFVSVQASPETDREGWCSPEFSSGCVLRDEPKLWDKDSGDTHS